MLVLHKCILLKIFADHFSEQVVESFPSDISAGICCGWACVGEVDAHKIVLSVRLNPILAFTHS